MTAAAHPLVKLARALGTPHGRKKKGLMLLEGVRAAEGALDQGVAPVGALVASTALKDARAAALRRRLEAARVRCVEVSDAVYAAVTRVPAPQGIALLCPVPAVDLAAVARTPFLVVADRLQDPGNLGALLRLAKAFGAGAVVTTTGSVEAAHPRALRAAAGAWPGLPVAAGIPVAEVALALGRGGRRVLAAVAHGGRPAPEARFTGSIAIVLGSEAHGLDPALAAGAEPVTIPLAGGVESLNVTTAAAILLAEAARQRAAAH